MGLFGGGKEAQPGASWRVQVAACDGKGRGPRVDLCNEAETEEFVAWLERDLTLKQLSLYSEGGCLRRTLPALQANATLRRLRICAMCCSSQDARVLAESLKQNHSLQELVLRSNFLGDRGAAHIAQMLAQNRGLRQLDLGRCGIANEGARFLGGALRENRTLQDLDLAFNSIGATGVQRLAEALCFNWSLKKLNLAESRTKMGDQAAQYLADTLMTNRSLEELDMTMNSISEEGLRKLARALRENCSMRVLKFRSNVCLYDAKAVVDELEAQLARNAPLPPAPATPAARSRRCSAATPTSCGSSSPTSLSAASLGLSPEEEDDLWRCRATGDWFGFNMPPRLSESV